MPIETAMAASAAEIVSSGSRYVTVSSPMPSYSSGVVMPRNPSFPSSSITFLGNAHVRSHSAANGSIFSLANSRASATTSRCSVAVSIKPLPRFPSQPSRCNHLLEQWRGAVFVLAEPVLKDFHDRKTDVETDEIGERKWPERMVHTELHDLIYRFRCADAFLHAKDRLVDHRHRHSVRHEARPVVLDWILPSVAAPCSLLPAPCFTRRAMFASIVFSARASGSAATSINTVSQPACANTCAMPLPIVPAPTTATRLMRRRPVRGR